MKATKAITLSLGELENIVISKYQFSLIVYRLYLNKKFKGENLNIQKEYASNSDVNNYLDILLDEGILSPLKGFPGIYTLLGRSNHSPEDIASTIDPFCYISHLSAMSYHGLTERIPSKLFISSPSPTDWSTYAKLQMQKDLKENYDKYIKNSLPKLVRAKMNKIYKTEVHCFHSKHLGAYKNVRGRALRVSTIGRTFLEMLKNPELCGGINHVISVFEEYGKRYERLIVDDIDANGSPIDKVRGGYILDELLGITNPTIEGWTNYAQRGGSRKLDAKGEYFSEWSDKWKLSINIF